MRVHRCDTHTKKQSCLGESKHLDNQNCTFQLYINIIPDNNANIINSIPTPKSQTFKAFDMISINGRQN